MKSNNRKVITGENHHWWPKGLSKHWANTKGQVYRIDYSGKVIPSKPKQFGQISDGHNILFHKESAWNSTVEGHFDAPDNAMPKIVDMLRNLRSKDDITKFSTIENDTDELNLLRECLLSLLVRSPRYRFDISSMLSSFRGNIGKQETRRLIPANMNQKYHSLVRSSKNRGRLVVLFSDGDEFLYGDGVYSTLSASMETLNSFKAVVPITPNIAVVWSIPITHNPYPKLSAKLVTDDVVSIINESTQIYSKEYLFYSNHKPILNDHFTCNEHLKYVDQNGPVTTLVRELIPERRLGW